MNRLKQTLNSLWQTAAQRFRPRSGQPAARGVKPSSFKPCLEQLEGRIALTGNIAIPVGGANFDWATAVANQGSKIVIAGNVQNSAGNFDFAVARLNKDGSLDKTFHGDGMVVLPFDLGGNNNDLANGVVVMGSKIVVVGSVEVGAGETDFGFLRLNKDGSLDAAFGVDFGDGRGRGRMFVSDNGISNDTAYGVRAQGSKIIVAGSKQISGGDYDFGVVRLNKNGFLDATFGNAGMKTVAFDRVFGGNDQAYGLALEGGKIIVVGQVDRGGGDFDFGVARLNKDGSLDGSFGSDRPGTVTVAFEGSNSEIANAVVVSGGKIVVVGEVDFGGGDLDFGVVRLNKDGSPDSTFDDNGKVTLAFDLSLFGNDEDHPNAVVVQGNKIVVVGFVERNGGDFDFGVVRLNKDGSLDTTFDGGKQEIAFELGGDDRAYGAVVQGSKIIIVGQVDRGGGNFDFGVARLNTDGSLDHTLVG